MLICLFLDVAIPSRAFISSDEPSRDVLLVKKLRKCCDDFVRPPFSRSLFEDLLMLWLLVS